MPKKETDQPNWEGGYKIVTGRAKKFTITIISFT